MSSVVATTPASRRVIARTIELAATTGSVPVARHVVRDDLRHRELLPSVIEDTLSVLTELVSNSIVHARPVRRNGSIIGIIVGWRVADEQVIVDITDGGGTSVPRLEGQSLTDAAGRGMTIVDRLSTFWSVRRRPGQVTVRAVIGS